MFDYIDGINLDVAAFTNLTEDHLDMYQILSSYSENKKGRIITVTGCGGDRDEVLKNITPFFSIIVTAYNIEKYIADCIESIKSQTFGSYECIIVDDGSDDDTGKVIADTISGDSRFAYLKTAHKGQAHAKNAGLSASHGKYVLFTDGDDTLTVDCLSGCAENVDGCDVLFFGINYQDHVEGNLVKNHPAKLPDLEFNSGSEFADRYIINHELLLYSAANKVYNKSVLAENSICFDEHLSFGEDRKFHYDFLRVSGKIKLLPNVYYNYRKIRSSSLTSKFRPHYIDKCLHLHDLKMQCILELSKHTTPAEKKDFELFDLDSEIRHAIQHIKEHADRISKEMLADEYDYLASRIPVKHFALADAHNSKKDRIRDFEKQIRSFEDSYSVKAIIRILNDAIDRSGSGDFKKSHDCPDTYSFIHQFSTRKGERQQSETGKDANKINQLLDECRTELYFAFLHLGLIRNNIVSWDHYDFILIAGGGNDANRQRVIKAKSVADDLSARSLPAGMIAALSAYRKIGEKEAEYIRDYAPGFDNEFDIITECLDNIFFKNAGESCDRVVLTENRHTNPTMSSRIIEFSRNYSSGIVRSYCAPKREESRDRADTRDCLEYFFDNTVVPKNSDILLVTSNPYCTSQFTADIAIEHEINLDIVGCTPDELCIGPGSFNCAKYLNELIKTYFEFERFRITYPEK